MISATIFSSLGNGYEITSSNAHNTFIQLFATAGIFVGTCYLLLNLYIIFCGVKLIIQSSGDSKLKITVYNYINIIIIVII